MTSLWLAVETGRTEYRVGNILGRLCVDRKMSIPTMGLHFHGCRGQSMSIAFVPSGVAADCTQVGL